MSFASNYEDEHAGGSLPITEAGSTSIEKSIKNESIDDVVPFPAFEESTNAGVTGTAIGSVSFTATNSTINLGCHISSDMTSQEVATALPPVSYPEVTREHLLASVGFPAISAPYSTINYGTGVNSALTRSLEGPHKPDREHWYKLIKAYKKEESWLTPFPWSDDTQLEQEDFYVPLKLDVFTRSGKEHKAIDANLEQLFDPVIEGGLRATSVLVRGDAGYGKSTLCQKVVYDWAHGVTAVRALPWDTILPVLYKLRRLDPLRDVGDQLFNFVHSYYAPEIDNAECTRVELRLLGKNLIIILDGYDEVDETTQKMIRKFIGESKDNKVSLFSRASFLVTSRPTSEKDFLNLFEKQFFISKMTRAKAKQLISSFYGKNAGDYLKFKKQFADLNLEKFSPLTIFTLCWLGKQLDKSFSNDSMDIAYSCIDLLATRCNMREGFGYSDEKINQLLRRLGMICHVSCQLRISEKLLQKCFKDEFTFIVNIGVLKRLPGIHSQEFWYEPLHKLFFDTLEQRYLGDSRKSVVEDIKDYYNEFFLYKNNFFRDCARAISLNFREDEETDVALHISGGGLHTKEVLFFSTVEGRTNLSFTASPSTPEKWLCTISLTCWDCNFVKITKCTVLPIISRYITQGLWNAEVYQPLFDLFVSSEVLQSEPCSLTSRFLFHFANDKDNRIQDIIRVIAEALSAVGEHEDAVNYNVFLWIKSPDCHVSKDFYSCIKDTFSGTDSVVRYKCHSRETGSEPVMSWNLPNAFRHFQSLSASSLNIYWYGKHKAEIVY